MLELGLGDKRDREGARSIMPKSIAVSGRKDLMIFFDLLKRPGDPVPQVPIQISTAISAYYED